MIGRDGGHVRMRVLQIVVLFIFVVITARLFYIQIIDTRYARMSDGNTLRREVQFAPRGDRKSTRLNSSH